MGGVGQRAYGMLSMFQIRVLNAWSNNGIAERVGRDVSALQAHRNSGRHDPCKVKLGPS